MDLLTSLPPEILPNICRFLPLEDRKNVRLTCQLLRHACDRADIVIREKFVFHFGFAAESHPHLAKCIENCGRLRPQVEFRGVNLTLLPLNVWEKFGVRITSLFMNCCTVNDEIIAGIFLRCSELVEIHLDVIAETELFGNESNPLDELIALRIERPKLRSFKLFTRRSLSDCTFRKIFKIFPNIQTFGRDQYYQSSYPSAPFRFRHDQRSISTPIELPPSVEHFIYNMNANSSWMVPYIRHPTIKFKKLEFTFTILNDQGMHNITEFFSSQSEVERLDLRILAGRCKPHLVKTILFHILKTLRKLEALKFNVNCEMEFSDLELANLMATIRNFKSLDLRFMACSHHMWTPRHKLPTTEYSRLVHLKLYSGFHTTQLQTEILSRCCPLRSLCLQAVDNETMKLIFRDHTELKELSLCYSDWSFIEEYPFHRLRNLEYLDLRYIRPTTLCVNTGEAWRQLHKSRSSLVALISKLNCPKLKVFLYQNSDHYLTEEDTIKVLRTLAQRTPQLETLRLDSYLPIRECHVPCRSLQKLRHLVQKIPFRGDNVSLALGGVYRQLFNSCPSLTYLVMDQCPESYAFFLNRRTGSLLSLRDSSAELLCETLNIPAYKYKLNIRT